MQLPTQMVAILREFSKRQGVPYNTLVQRWLSERILKEYDILKREQAKERKKSGPPTGTCTECGNQFLNKNWTAKTCSYECSTLRQERQTKESQQRHTDPEGYAQAKAREIEAQKLSWDSIMQDFGEFFGDIEQAPK